jgi:hypothetical protein
VKLIIEPYARAGEVEGYTYLLEKEGGEIVASGYYKTQFTAHYYGRRALSIYEKERV